MKGGDKVLLRTEHLLQPQYFASQPDYFVQMRFLRVHEDVFLELLDLVLDPVADINIIIDDKVDEMIEEPVGRVNFLVPQNRLKRPDFIDSLAGYGNDEMFSEKMFNPRRKISSSSNRMLLITIK